MINQQRAEMVTQLAKPGMDVLESLTPEKANLWHAVTGIMTEAGELLDAVKKHVIYEQELDRENVIEELGDMEYYLEQFRQQLNVQRVTALEHNIAKLRKRYGKQYSNSAARLRADKSS